MRLVAFTSEKFHTDAASEAAMLNSLLPYVDALHIRKMDGGVGDLKKMVEGISPAARKKVWLHDHYELALEYRLGGIHVSRKALAENKALNTYAAIHGLGASISCHKLVDAERLSELYDRVFICPVYESISKAGHSADWTLDDVRTVLQGEHDAEMIALGGVTEQNIIELKALGFDGAAVLGSLWQADDPVAYVKQLKELCQQAVNTY